MIAQSVWVPFSVLNAPDHLTSTKLIWLLLRTKTAGSETAAHLQAASGLDPRTIAHVRARLARAPLPPCHARPHPHCAEIPAPLLTTSTLSPGARLLYGQLQSVPGCKGNGGTFTFATLSGITGMGHVALGRAARELAAAGWLSLTQSNRKRPLEFTLHNPVATELSARISSLRRRVKAAPNKGEFLLREFLNLRVAIRQFEENATPGILLNPYTKELMELDRYYPTAAVAFEFNGDQHHEETDLATYEQTVKQVGRDAMKAFICKTRGIELVIIHPEDLSLKVLEQKIPQRLPRRDMRALEPLVAELEAQAAEYRKRTAEERARRRA